MQLSTLIKAWLNVDLPHCEITGLQNDSRKVEPGDVFLAYPGEHTDGRLYIDNAITSGANAIIYEAENWPAAQALPAGIIALPLSNLANKLAAIASCFYANPSRKLTVTGITGTNGKTTIAYQLAQAYTALGRKAAYIGTLGQGLVGQLTSLANTTPDALSLQQLLATYAKEDITAVCMEVSSHALCQRRVDCIDFKQAIFTNLSHEHLDYHQTMEAYAKAKALLLAMPTLEWAIINQDDAYSQMMQSAVCAANCDIVSYGFKSDADVAAKNYYLSLAQSHCDIISPWGEIQIRTNLVGQFNIANILAVFTSLMAAGFHQQEVAAVISQLRAVPGRMELLATAPYMIVDYAHTPDALKQALLALRELCKGRILVVFGCGGDRDKGKRPLMGKIASDYADLIILTNDNPRTEDPLMIIGEIKAGIDKPYLWELPDRKEAILTAINLAKPEDVILVAGKGHEDYQIMGNKRYHFSDQEVIRSLLKL